MSTKLFSSNFSFLKIIGTTKPLIIVKENKKQGLI